MIRLPDNIYLATAPVDLHWSFDRLAGLVRDVVRADPRASTVVVFHNRRRTHVKLLWHDGSGYCVFYKRLDRAAFRIPESIPTGATRITMSARELSVLLQGIDRSLLRAARRSIAKTAPRPMTLRDAV
jgi:transposase